MSTRSFIVTISLAAVIWIAGYQAIANSAPPRKLAPPWVCTMANRLEIFVDEDNIMYACECEALSTGHICRWQVIGGVERLRRLRRQRLIPVQYVKVGA